MNARPFLAKVARLLDRLKFDVVLIGNAAAALQGALVTTVDFDFLATVHGLRSFAGVPARVTMMALDGGHIRVATLADIIRSKRAARRPRDLAVLDILEKARAEADRSAKTGGGRRSRE